MEAELTCLGCGCCGGAFMGKQTPEHDTGMGTCPKCEKWIEKNYTNRLIGQMMQEIRRNLSPEKLAKWNTLSLTSKKAFALRLYEKGAFTWTIGGQ